MDKYDTLGEIQYSSVKGNHALQIHQVPVR